MTPKELTRDQATATVASSPRFAFLLTIAAVTLTLMILAVQPSQAQIYTVPYAFPSDELHGAFPSGPVILDAEGNVYGVTSNGGDGTINGGSCNNTCGTLFRLDTQGVENVLHVFDQQQNGTDPSGNLVRDQLGNSYGTARVGGSPASAPYSKSMLKAI
jgi:uncharacterized repeat protein (TIGR03803 family)